jgi:hypothetical protein
MITQLRMKAFAIVVHFNIFEHLILGLSPGLEPLTVHRLDLKTVVPAFHGGIIVTIALFAHATDQLVFAEKFLVSNRTILAAQNGKSRLSASFGSITPSSGHHTPRLPSVMSSKIAQPMTRRE